MKRLITICAIAGAVTFAAPAFADTMYNPSNGQTYSSTATTTPQGYVAEPSYSGGPFEHHNRAGAHDYRALRYDDAAGRRRNRRVYGSSANLVPYNPHCFIQTDFNGRHTAMCGP